MHGNSILESKFLCGQFIQAVKKLCGKDYIYEVCPKSNETGVIKTILKSIEIYQSQIPSK